MQNCLQRKNDVANTKRLNLYNYIPLSLHCVGGSGDAIKCDDVSIIHSGEEE